MSSQSGQVSSPRSDVGVETGKERPQFTRSFSSLSAAVPKAARSFSSSVSGSFRGTPRLTKLAGPQEGSGTGVVSATFSHLGQQEALPNCFVGKELNGAVVLVLDLTGVEVIDVLEAHLAPFRDILGQLDRLPAGCPPRFFVFLGAQRPGRVPQVDGALDLFLSGHSFSLEDPVAKPFFMDSDDGDEMYAACRQMCSNVAAFELAGKTSALKTFAGGPASLTHQGFQEVANTASSCCNCCPWTKRGSRDSRKAALLDGVDY